MRKIERAIAYLLSGIVLVDIFLIVFVADWQVTANSLPAALLMVLWLIASLAVAGIGLTVIYRKYLSHWSTWVVLVSLCVLGALSIQGLLSISDPRLSLLNSLLFLFAGSALLTAVTILFVQRDIGAPFIGIVTLIDVWGIFFIWRTQGNLIEDMFLYLETGQSASIWLLNLLFCASILLTFIAALSFAGHTIRLIYGEIKTRQQQL